MSKGPTTSSGRPPKLRAPKASQIVAGDLRRSIVKGEIAEGTVLGERELLIHFGVSRPTLREAIRLLESEQLLELTYGPGGGARVLRPSIDVAARYFGLLLQVDRVRLADVYAASALIEPAAIRLIARTRPVEAAKALRACVDETSLDPADVTINAIAFSRFHRIIIEQAGNQTLIRLMSLLTNIFDHYLGATAAIFGKRPDVETRISDQIKMRRAVVDLIESGNGEDAARIWAEFLDEASAQLQEWQPRELVVELLQN